jgi:hypothetical protein
MALEIHTTVSLTRLSSPIIEFSKHACTLINYSPLSVHCFFQKLYDIVFVLVYKHAQVSVVFGNRNLLSFDDTAQGHSVPGTLMSPHTCIAHVVPFGKQSRGEASTAIPALLQRLTDAAVRAVARQFTHRSVLQIIGDTFNIFNRSSQHYLKCDVNCEFIDSFAYKQCRSWFPVKNINI